MIKTENRHAVSAGGTCNGNHSIEIQAAVVKGVGQVDRVGMKRRDQVGARREILCPAGMREHSGDKRNSQQPCYATLPLRDIGQNCFLTSSEWRETQIT